MYTSRLQTVGSDIEMILALLEGFLLDFETKVQTLWTPIDQQNEEAIYIYEIGCVWCHSSVR